MPGDVPETVTCEICGTTFDPADSRGWCPNAECGRWQHPAFRDEADESDGSDAGDGIAAPTKTCPNCRKQVRADANFCKFCAHQFEQETDTAGEPDAEEPSPGTKSVLNECPHCNANLSRIPSDQLSDCPICGRDLDEVLAESEEPPVRPADLHTCPACEADLTNIPPDMRLVCPGCQVSLEEAIEEDVDGAHAHAGVDVLTGIAEGYSDRLAGAGVETVGDLVRADPAPLAEATDIAESRIAEWIDRAPVEAPDTGESSEPEPDVSPDTPSEPEPDQPAGGDEAAPGTPARDVEPSGTPDRADAASTPDPDRAGGTPAGDASAGDPESGAGSGSTEQPSAPPASSDRAGTGDASPDPVDVEMETQLQPTPPNLVLDVMGREIQVEDGDTVGKEIRTAMVQGGADKEDARYVHREHARIDKVDDQWYLTRLGENSLKINDEPVGEHERVKVRDGDELAFSEVVTATVRVG